MVVLQKALRIILLSMIIVIIFCSSLFAYNGTIITKDSVEYKDVNFSINFDFNNLSFIYDKEVVNVYLFRVDRIFDSKGNDITDKVLSSSIDYDSKILEERSFLVGNSFNNRPWSYGFSFAPGYSMPMGEYYRGIEAGFGIGGSMFFKVSKGVDFRLNISKLGFKLPSYADPLKISAWRFSAAIQYQPKFIKSIQSDVAYYMYTGIGAVSLTGYASGYSGSYNEFKLALSEGVGVLFITSRSFAFELSIAYDLIFIGNVETFDGGSKFTTAGAIELKLGIVFLQ